MQTAVKAYSFEITLQDVSALCHIKGEITLSHLPRLEREFKALLHQKKCENVSIILDELLTFDSAAALLLLQVQENFKNKNINCFITLKQEEFRHLFDQVSQHRPPHNSKALPNKEGHLEKIGKHSVDKLSGIKSFFAFSGELSIAFLGYLQNIKTIRYKEIMFEMNESAIKALGIIALTTFLIGIVIAYQSSVQLKIYGANIFIVDMLGISILRELAPLITAIVVAGRSGSAYAAQIGVMKLTEELDAMRTMGFDPYRFLVLPRIIALMLMMPLLIFFADIMGVLGGMVIAKVELDITPSMFIDRFSTAVDIKHFYIGLFKGPFFAFLIGAIGAFRGLMVKNDTQSIGINTTKSVVESIFAVIMCDAFFSIIFTNLGY